MLFGALIGSLVKNVPLAIVLAYLSHYFLDLIPHIEYPTQNVEKKNWRITWSDFIKIFLDFCLGGLLVFMFANQKMAYIGAIVATTPDVFTVLSRFFPNKILGAHDNFHLFKVHFLEHKKIPPGRADKFWRILTQLAIVAISIKLLV